MYGALTERTHAMSNSWNEGYFTDVGYTFGYYREINPVFQRFCLLLRADIKDTHVNLPSTNIKDTHFSCLNNERRLNLSTVTCLH